MAYQKLQVGLAAVVIPSDTVDIPLISSSRLTGTNTGPAAANKLLDSSASFDTVQGFITPGAIVVNETDGTKTIVNSVDSATELSLESDIFTATGKEYSIYLDPEANHSEGCIIYCGATGDIKVTTVRGNDIVYVGVPTGTFLPVQVIRVWENGTTATSLVANW